MKERLHVFVLGATGFIGREVVREALAQGHVVTGLARSAEKAAPLAAMGARVAIGDADRPAEWAGDAAGCDLLIDLLQPELPARVGLREIRSVAARRTAMTSRLLAALESIAEPERPLLLAVSGLDDLTRDEGGNVDDGSAPAAELSGFSYIGIPVRRLIEASGVRRAYAYLGTVYGPGKSFASKVFPQLAAGRFRLPGGGGNRMALVHVEDAARALLHIAGTEAGGSGGRSFVVADGHPATLAEVMGFAAERLGGPRPKSVPLALARLVAGRVLVETLTRDIAAHPAALLESGFAFRYPTYRDGLPPSIEALGYPRTRPVRGILDGRAVFAVVSVLAIGALAAENGLDFPLSVPYMKKLAGGAPLLDMRPGYSPEAAYELLDSLGRDGRTAYLKLLWTVDLVLPALFGAFLFAAIRRGALRSWRFVPAAAAVFDYAENTAITTLVWRYPERHPAVAYVAAGFTVVKLAGYAAGVLAAAWGSRSLTAAALSSGLARVGALLFRRRLPGYPRDSHPACG